MKILYLPLEFGKWRSAKKLSYPTGIGLIEGFKDIDHVTIPLMYHEDKWLKHIKELVGNQTFDQVWLEVVHSIVPNHILEWIASLAPIRVGFVVESLTIAPKEFIDNPIGTNRRVSNLNSKLPYLTHAVVCDARDLDKLEIPSFLFNAAIPERFIKTPNSTDAPALFCGTTYGDRSEWVKALGDLLVVNPPSAETKSYLPYLFEQLFTTNYDAIDYPLFFKNWCYVRSTIYDMWIKHLHSFSSCAIVNLPHRTQVASGRISEGMAAGKPMTSQRLNNDMDSRFLDRKNILYYDDLIDLIDIINELREDSEFRFSVAKEAIKNVLKNHTTEVLVKRILEFVG